MIHNPCDSSAASPCVKHGRCSKRFPKPYRLETGSVEGDYYINYKRRSKRDGGEVSQLCRSKRGMPRTITFDNSLIVPHSPDLLRKFKTHMKVELCISKVGSIKYLFKYICKGPDRVTVEVQAGQADKSTESTPKEVPTIDETRQFQGARYVSASEAAWRLFSFPMVEHMPPVKRLEVH